MLKSSTPKFERKNYRFLAAFFFVAFFFAAFFAFFAIWFSPKVVVAQPLTANVTVTTDGLSHPPSYQM